jgi:SAM-dependent methyltransferase
LQAGIACALVEPGLDGALAARARGIDPVICARLEDIGFAPESIDAAGLFDVLEHIENEASALHQVRTILKPGGRLFVTVPAYSFLHSADDIAAGHFRRYTLASLSNALRSAGFRLENRTYMFAPLPPLVFLLRTVPSWFGLREGADEQRQAAEHAPSGIAARVVERLLDLEARRIEAGRSIPFGTSCAAVAVRD